MGFIIKVETFDNKIVYHKSLNANSSDEIASEVCDYLERQNLDLNNVLTIVRCEREQLANSQDYEAIIQDVIANNKDNDITTFIIGRINRWIQENNSRSNTSRNLIILASVLPIVGGVIVLTTDVTSSWVCVPLIISAIILIYLFYTNSKR